MNFLHQDLSLERWSKMSLLEQLANVGTDIERTIQWKKRGDCAASRAAFDRALELLYLTIKDPKNRKRLKEICRARYLLVDHFVYDNEYHTTDQQWQDCFYQFNYAAALARGK
ncbi:MAG: hypothetical protein AMXMBFR12_07290 [Candidatus Babeliales bacterium]